MGFLLCARTIIIYFQCTEHFAPIRFVITAIDSITPAHNKLTKVPASRKTPVQNPVPHPPLVDIIIIHIRAPGLTPPGRQKRHMAWSSRHIHFPFVYRRGYRGSQRVVIFLCVSLRPLRFSESSRKIINSLFLGSELVFLSFLRPLCFRL